MAIDRRDMDLHRVADRVRMLEEYLPALVELDFISWSVEERKSLHSIVKLLGGNKAVSLDKLLEEYNIRQANSKKLNRTLVIAVGVVTLLITVLNFLGSLVSGLLSARVK